MKAAAKTELLVSIVSHNEGSEVEELLGCIEKYCLKNLVVVITLNVDEQLSFKESDFSFPIFIVRNQRLKGFGANHNQAFTCMDSKYFCVLNTDVYFFEDPFSNLINNTNSNEIGVVAPIVYNKNDQLQDSARKLPTPFKLLQRRLMKRNEYLPPESIRYVDWIAGFFMLFESEQFKKLGGFNEKYYLYCEDVDICSRIWLSGRKVAWNSNVAIYHDAKRRSHEYLYYFAHHIRSLLLLFCSKVYYTRLYQKYQQCKYGKSHW
jgi:N-acetylglucosaminyl-diphospho-decaprenol L-rhamnosyltransferase